jgi:hypothetical protein
MASAADRQRDRRARKRAAQRRRVDNGGLYLRFWFRDRTSLEDGLKASGLLDPLAETTNEDLRAGAALALGYLVGRDDPESEDVPK